MKTTPETKQKKSASKNSVNNRVRGLVPFKKGESGNPNGRPKGRKDYATLFREAIIIIAELNKVDPESIEAKIVQKGLSEALKGDYRFYKDHLDRMHGQATQPIASDSKNPFIVKIVQYASDDTTQLPPTN